MGRQHGNLPEPPPQSKAVVPISAPPPKHIPEGNTPHKRARLSKGKAVLPPSETNLQGHLNFSTAARKQRYSEVCIRQILPCKYIHYPTLEELGLQDAFDVMIDNIGWRKYVEINCPAFIELTREFYTTFAFIIPSDFTLDSPQVIQYRLMGKEYKQSITEFNIAMGLITKEDACTESYKTSRVDFDTKFRHVSLWKSMSVDPRPYDPSQSQSTYLREPVWQCVQRFLAFSYSGRKASSVTCTKTELYFLWAMLNNVKVNLGCWLAYQFQAVLTKKRGLILGSFITHLAINLGLLDLKTTQMHKACDMEPLDLKCMGRMGIVQYRNGGYHFQPPGRLPSAKELKCRRTETKEPETGPSSADESSNSDDNDEDVSLQRLEHKIQKMETNLDAFFRFMKFTPPCPPSP